MVGEPPTSQIILGPTTFIPRDKFPIALPSGHPTWLGNPRTDLFYS